jgi:hypothetical protein
MPVPCLDLGDFYFGSWWELFIRYRYRI